MNAPITRNELKRDLLALQQGELTDNAFSERLLAAQKMGSGYGLFIDPSDELGIDLEPGLIVALAQAAAVDDVGH